MLPHPQGVFDGIRMGNLEYPSPCIAGHYRCQGSDRPKSHELDLQVKGSAELIHAQSDLSLYVSHDARI